MGRHLGPAPLRMLVTDRPLELSFIGHLLEKLNSGSHNEGPSFANDLSEGCHGNPLCHLLSIVGSHSAACNFAHPDVSRGFSPPTPQSQDRNHITIGKVSCVTSSCCTCLLTPAARPVCNVCAPIHHLQTR